MIILAEVAQDRWIPLMYATRTMTDPHIIFVCGHCAEPHSGRILAAHPELLKVSVLVDEHIKE